MLNIISWYPIGIPSTPHPPQRFSACCSWTCWCSCRSKTTRWSSNATARVTLPCRRASRCWVPLSSWTQSSCVRWPQVSRHAASLTCCHGDFHRGINLVQPKDCTLFFCLSDRSKGFLCDIYLGKWRSDLWTGGSVCWREKIVGSQREHDRWFMC